MNFKFGWQNLSPSEKRLQRLFEILPGLTSWSILIGMVWMALNHPTLAACVVIAFDLYWILRLFYMTFFLYLSYFRLSAEKETDWLKRIDDLHSKEALAQIETKIKSASFKEWISLYPHLKNLELLKKRNLTAPPLNDIVHLVIFAVAKESRKVIEPGIQSIAQGRFPSQKILIYLAVEQRAEESIQNEMLALKAEYATHFMDFKVVLHPPDLAQEARVKGANATYCAKQAAYDLTQKNISFENVIVSCFDADTVVSPSYFACLTYCFLACPDRTRSSFQPIPVYQNNIWNVPAFARVLEAGSSFFQMVEATNPEKLVTFSSHSMSFKALHEIDYWPVDMISDDSAVFWKAFLHYQGRYRAIPMYVTLSMDIPDAGSLGKTMVNVYKQKRRWAWGVENFPIVMRGFIKSREISLFDKLRHGFKLFEGHVAWATWPFLLTIISWLPTFMANREFSDSVLYYNAPIITGIIANLACITFAGTIVISLLLLPRKKEKFGIWRRIRHAVEWIFIPVIAIFFSAIPALDAQTRLMRAKHMEFWVTVKKRK
jgi:hypothetical protein